MDRYLSRVLFSADITKNEGQTAKPAYKQITAREAGFDEAWLQNAVAQEPQLVVAPCSEAGLTDERWWFWAREFEVEVGPIDVLLISDSGRVGLVETKLAYNPESRRSVLAQLLDYAVHLGEVEAEDLPPLPTGVRLSKEEVARRIQDERDFLLVVAGDELNARAVKLGRSLLGDHLMNEWQLALVEVSVFKLEGASSGVSHLLVPHIRGAIETERRQTVKVIVEGDKSRVVVERVEPLAADKTGIQWDEKSFLAAVEANPKTGPIRELCQRLTEFERLFPGSQIRWGGGRTASALLKRNGRTLVEIYAGHNQVVLPKELGALTSALGDAAAKRWLDALVSLFPEQLKMTKPTIRSDEPTLAKLLPLLNATLSEAVGK